MPYKLLTFDHDRDCTLTRKDLALRFAERMGIDPEEAPQFVETFMDIILDAIGRGDRIEIRGFGVFQIKEYESHKARNPKTGASVTVDKKRTVKFKAGKALQTSVREAGFKAMDEQK